MKILLTLLLSTMIPNWHQDQIFDKSKVYCAAHQVKVSCSWIAKFEVIKLKKRAVYYKVSVAKLSDVKLDSVRTDIRCKAHGIGIYKVRFQAPVMYTRIKKHTIRMISSHFCK